MLKFLNKKQPALVKGPSDRRALILAILIAPLVATSAFGTETAQSADVDTLSPSVRVEVERTLVIEGGTSDLPRQLNVSSQQFDSWEALFNFLGRNLGAKLIYDEAGDLIGASGNYLRSGEVLFGDGGERFDSHDYIASYLGGRSGTVRIGDEDIVLPANNATADDFQNLRVTDCVGESCIAGESWVTHEPLAPFTFYHAVGGRTTQISGGTVERVIYYCSDGTLVGGQSANSQCRVPDNSNCVFELPDRIWVCAGGEEFSYVPSKTRREEVLSNVLTQTLRIRPGSHTVSGQGINTLKIEKSSWTIIRDFKGKFPIPLQFIEGICGNHVSNRGGNVDSWDGDTGPAGNCTGE